MGFDTGYGGGDQQGDGGSFFDDPSFLAQLQGAFGGGYDQAPPETAYGAIGGAPGGPVNLGAGGGALFGPHPTPVSLPDGSQATSPFEVGGNSGGPVSAGNGYGAAAFPGGPGLDPYRPHPNDPNDPNSYQYMMAHPPMFSQDYGPNSANAKQQAEWQRKLNEARLRDGIGGGGTLQDTLQRFQQPQQPYGGREGDPRDMGNGRIPGGGPPNNWIGGWGGLPEGYSGPVGPDGRPLPYNPDGSQQQIGGGGTLQDLMRRFQQPQQPYGGREGDPRDMGNGRIPGVGYNQQQMPHYGDLSWGESHMGKQYPSGGGQVGGWYGGYGQQGGGGQQQWYRPQGPQGSSRPDSSNPGAAYDAGPGRWEAQQQAQRDQMNTQAQGPRQPQGGPQRWGMPMGGAYGRPMPMRKRRFYGNGGGPMPPGSPGAASNLGGPAYQTQGPAPTGGGY